ncbi:putative oxidoreductase, aryl-alcohol dehydrogenase like protein [Actinospica robiniae DSM 44927]|uniref:Putative oxidoreductase, aryl-alcohol dehydrogenase like protein n=2 Tax=Actinospica robiniae TaxID=304901 RepID=W9DWE9_9ACTN|nr:aldo/keto reductase [Actinospica robiniae]ETA71154.1 putative oxidoreductase, aryl-alcohol dehydrogenase like protein [Actinospica robiniae DSM 44927]
MARSHRVVGAVGVGGLALGCAALSLEHHADPTRGRAVIEAALDAGIRMLDTAAAYTSAAGPNENERLIRDVLAARRSDAARPLVATKGGHLRQGDEFPIDARPESLRRDCEASLSELGIEQIDLYFLHWPDPEVPIEESVGALDDLRREGKIAHIGVSNIGLDELAAARRTATIEAVQNHYSLFDVSGQPVLDQCAEAGIAFLAYSPLRGLAQAEPVLSGSLGRVAGVHGVHAALVALAWLLARSPALIPVVGATRPETARDAAAASQLNLSADELAELNCLIA